MIDPRTRGWALVPSHLDERYHQVWQLLGLPLMMFLELNGDCHRAVRGT